MANPTEPDDEPTPRAVRASVPAPPWTGSTLTELPRSIREPDASFLTVLRNRRSIQGQGQLSVDDLGSLLWHATMPRERRPSSDGGAPWESRAAPSAGGLHSVGILVLPVNNDLPCGIHIPDRHALAALRRDATAALFANAASIQEMIGSTLGVTLQFFADLARLAAAYENTASLAWRDAGALLATIALVAEALELCATPLGRAGSLITELAGLGTPRWKAVGAVHLTGRIEH